MNYLKAMFWTGVSAFIAVFVPSALGWLNEVSSTGHLADPSALRSAGIAAVAAAVTAVITAGTVALRGQSWFPGQQPIYPPAAPDQGAEPPPFPTLGEAKTTGTEHGK